jgi:hypothetical protein
MGMVQVGGHSLDWVGGSLDWLPSKADKTGKPGNFQTIKRKVMDNLQREFGAHVERGRNDLVLPRITFGQSKDIYRYWSELGKSSAIEVAKQFKNAEPMSKAAANFDKRYQIWANAIGQSADGKVLTAGQTDILLQDVIRASEYDSAVWEGFNIEGVFDRAFWAIHETTKDLARGGGDILKAILRILKWIGIGAGIFAVLWLASKFLTKQ